jgi:hypothetical protein
MEGLRGLRRPQDVAELRGLTIKQVLGIPKEEASSEQQAASSDAPDPVAVVAEAPATEGDDSREEKSDG